MTVSCAPITTEERLNLSVAVLANCPHRAQLQCQLLDEEPPCCPEGRTMLGRLAWLVWARRTKDWWHDREFCKEVT